MTVTSFNSQIYVLIYIHLYVVKISFFEFITVLANFL